VAVSQTVIVTSVVIGIIVTGSVTVVRLISVVWCLISVGVLRFVASVIGPVTVSVSTAVTVIGFVTVVTGVGFQSVDVNGLGCCVGWLEMNGARQSIAVVVTVIEIRSDVPGP